MITIALRHSDPDPAHLAEVTATMTQLGAPVIAAVWMECHGCWAALEGCHRIHAAKALGLVPIIREIEYSDALLSDIGLSDFNDAADFTVARIADDCYRSEQIAF